MATSPLELYESAYRLHYVENRIPEAVASYKRLIKEFPDANECGYAVIQLQKIKAQSVADDISDEPVPPRFSKQSHPLIAVSLIVAMCSLLLTVYLHYTLSSRLRIERNRLSTALDALGKISRNEDSDALQLLNELKSFDPENIAPYELSADIYRKQARYSDARNEYVTYFKNNPDKKPSLSVVTLMALDKSKDTRPAITTPEPPQPPANAPVSKNVVPDAKKTPPNKRVKTSKPPPPPSPTRSKKTKKRKRGLLLIDPDSISYF